MLSLKSHSFWVTLQHVLYTAYSLQPVLTGHSVHAVLGVTVNIGGKKMASFTKTVFSVIYKLFILSHAYLPCKIIFVKYIFIFCVSFYRRVLSIYKSSLFVFVDFIRIIRISICRLPIKIFHKIFQKHYELFVSITF